VVRLNAYFTLILFLLYPVSVNATEDWEAILQSIWDRQRSDYSAALERAKEALALAEKQGAERPRVAFLNEIAWIAWHLREPVQALEKARLAEQLAASRDWQKERGDALNFQGLALHTMGKFKEAEKAFLAALEIRKQLGYRRGVASVTNNISRLYMAQDLYWHALDILDEALEEMPKPQTSMEWETLGVIHNNRGACLAQLHQDDAWPKAFDEGMKAALNAGSLNLQLENLDYRAHALAIRGQFDALRKLLDESRRLTDDEPLWQRRFALHQANFLVNQGEIGETVEKLWNDLQSGSAAFPGSSSYQRSIAWLGYRLFQSKGDYQTANQHLLRYLNLERKRFEHAIQQEVFRMREELQLQETEAEVADLRAEVQMERLETEKAHLRSSQKQILLIFALVIVSLLGLLWYMQFRSRRRVEKLNKELEKFQRMTAHDLKNPLAAIATMAELLESDDEFKTGWSSREFGSNIGDAATQMRGIIDNLLDFHRLAGGAWQTRPRSFELIEVLDPIVASFQVEAQNKQQQLSLQEPGQPIILFQDPFALERVMANLLSNAIKFSPSGGKIHLSVQLREDTVAIRLQDSGPGISHHDSQRLFKPYQQLSAKPTGGESSTGIGLSVVGDIVRLMEGKVDHHNHPKGGSVFTVTLSFRQQPIPCNTASIRIPPPYT